MARSIPDAQILDAAVKLVVERGFSQATTREIAKAAGVNEVTLFRRFGNKAELLREAMSREISGFGAAGGAQISGELEADFRRTVQLYIKFLQRKGALIPVLLAEAKHSPILKEVIAQPQLLLKQVITLIEHYQGTNELVQEPADQVLLALLGPLLAQSLLLGMASELSSGWPEADVYVGRFLHGRRG